MSSDPLRKYARFIAEVEGTDADRFERKIEVESSFNPRATSGAGARGMSQFMPDTGKRYGLNSIADFYDPFKSLNAGAKHTADLEREHGDPVTALVGYNGSPTVVKRFKKGGYAALPDETKGYLDKIVGELGRSYKGGRQAPAPQQDDASSLLDSFMQEVEGITGGATPGTERPQTVIQNPRIGANHSSRTRPDVSDYTGTTPNELITTSAAPRSELYRYSPNLELDFEEAKSRGDLEKAREVANELGQRGYEVGPGERGFPYQKRPSFHTLTDSQKAQYLALAQMPAHTRPPEPTFGDFSNRVLRARQKKYAEQQAVLNIARRIETGQQELSPITNEEIERKRNEVMRRSGYAPGATTPEGMPLGMGSPIVMQPPSLRDDALIAEIRSDRGETELVNRLDQEELARLRALSPQEKRIEATRLARKGRLSAAQRDALGLSQGGLRQHATDIVGSLTGSVADIVGQFGAMAEQIPSVVNPVDLVMKPGEKIAEIVSGTDLPRGSTAIRMLGDEGSAYAREQINKYGGEGFISDVERGIAGSVPIVAAGMAGGGATSVGLLGGLQTAGQIRTEALSAGRSPEEATAISLIGLPIGLTEMFGAGGAGIRYAKGQFGKSIIRTIFREGGEELGQNKIQGILQDLTAKGFYDPDRDIFIGLDYEDLVAAVTGAAMGGTLHVASHMAAQVEERQQQKTSDSLEALRLSLPSGVSSDHLRTVVNSAKPSASVQNPKSAIIADSKTQNNEMVPAPTVYPATAPGGGDQSAVDAPIDLAQEPASDQDALIRAYMEAKRKETEERALPHIEANRRDAEARSITTANTPRSPEDELYSRAVKTTQEFGKYSPTVLQRRFGLKYGDATRLIDRMKQEGVLSGSTKKVETEKHEFSSTQVSLPDNVASSVKELASEIPDSVLAPDGREDSPHITVKYGIHGDDVNAVREALADEAPITVKLGETSLFENKEHDVVKIDVDSPGLHRLNEKIADAVPHTDTHPDYKPHVTVAYVKPGKGEQFEGDDSLKGKEITLDTIEFSDRNGNVTEIPLGVASKVEAKTGILTPELRRAAQAMLDVKYDPDRKDYGPAAIGFVVRKGTEAFGSELSEFRAALNKAGFANAADMVRVYRDEHTAEAAANERAAIESEEGDTSFDFGENVKESDKPAKKSKEQFEREESDRRKNVKEAIADFDAGKINAEEAAIRITDTGEIELPDRIADLLDDEGKLKTEPEGVLAGTRKLIDTIKSRLRSGEGVKNNPILTKLADEAFGGTRAEGKYNAKDSADALEVAVNEYIKENAYLYNNDAPSEVLSKMRDLLRLLPTQSDRTTEQIELQQFSTPPTEAFVVAQGLAIRPGDVIVEPSAGTGSLATWAKAIGGSDVTVHTNEIDARRRGLLEMQGFETTNVDAEFLDDLLPESIQPTAVITNPPFSATGGRVKRHDSKFGARHIEEDLKRLAPNGRLVGVVSEGMAMDKPKMRDWWNRILGEYNVRANVSVPGEEYGKYGTTYGNQIIVIDKTGPTPGKNLAEQYSNVITSAPENLEGVLNALYPVINDRPEIAAEQPVRSGEMAGVSGDISRTNGGSRRAEEAVRRDEPVGTGKQPGQAARPAEPHRPAESSEPIRKPESANQSKPTEQRGTVRHSSGVGESVQRGLLSTTDAVRYERSTEKREAEGENFVQYKPAKLKGGKPHPGNIVESASMAAVDPPDITYRPKLDQGLIERGELSDLQLEAITYAGQRHEQKLSNGNRAGFFIGDGTGVGKGRILAGIALDNWNQGRKRVLWLSVNNDLLPSTKRDLTALGGKDIPLSVINDYAASEKTIDFGDGVLFSAYPSLTARAKNGQERFEQIRQWLGDEGIIMFDEGHLMKNAVTSGMKKSSQRGEKGVALQEGEKSNPNWKIVYASATGATDVENMGYMVRLGLWGDGTSFPGGFPEFRAAIEAGGVGAMEMVSRDMKAMGMYTARTLSYKGVEYRESTHKLTAGQRKLYDTSARAWQLVLSNIDKALDVTNADSRAKMHAMMRYWGDQQRFFRQFLTAMKVPTAIKEIEKAVDAGNSVVLGLYGTGESRTADQVKKAMAEGDDLENLDFSPKEVIINLVDKAFPTIRFTEASDPNNPDKIIKVMVKDADGNPVHSKTALKMKEKLLAELEKLSLPDNPLDQIINHFGPDTVAEITGRQKRLVRDESGRTRYVKRVEGVSMEKASVHEMEAFQDGRKRIAIISASASTGISLHADRTAKNQQRRVHITLETGWSADIQMQTFGRTHRTNQASAPEYVLLASDVGGEKRFLSTIAKRLASLGALTRGERKATGVGSSEQEGLEKYDFLNDYGAAAIKNMTSRVKTGRSVGGVEHPYDSWKKMGLIKDTSDGIKIEEPDVDRLLNRVLALEIDEQNSIFGWFVKEFEGVVNNAKATGTFDEGVTDIKAEAVRLVNEQPVATEKTTGAETLHFQLEVDEKTKPVSYEKAISMMQETDSAGMIRQKRSNGLALKLQIASRTDPMTGLITERFRIVRQNGSEDVIDAPELRDKYTDVDHSEVRDEWVAGYKASSKVRTREVHVIGGAIIPVWQRLQSRNDQGRVNNLKVVRVETDDGRRIVGVQVPAKSVSAVLRAIGVSRSFKSPQAIFEGILEDNEQVELVSGLKLRKIRFKGSDAIELTGADQKIVEMKKLGLLHEIINYSDKLLVPTDEAKGVEVLTKLLERYPAMGSEKKNPSERYASEEAESEEPDVMGMPATRNPKSLSQFVRSKGGILDDGSGEANRLKRKESGSTGLVTKNGLSPDLMREAAVEAGYFSSDSPEAKDANVFLEAVEDDLRGIQKVYSLEDHQTLEEEQLDEYEEYLRSTLTDEEWDEYQKAKRDTEKREEIDRIRRELFGGTGFNVSQFPSDNFVKARVSSTDVVQSYEKVIRASGGMTQIRVGRFREKMAGIYKPKADIARLKTANDIPSAAHEIGHAFQKAIYGEVKAGSLKSLPPDVKRELLRLGKALYGEVTPAGGYKSEGFAEFIRYYLTRDDAGKVAPNTLKYFESRILALDPKIEKAMAFARKQTDRYRKEGAENRAKANIDRGPTLTGKILKAFRALRHAPTYMIDEFTPLLKLSEQVEKKVGKLRASQDPFKVASFLRGSAPATVHYMVFDGMMDFARNRVGSSLQEAVAMVKGNKEDFTVYLWARRALERWGQGKNPGMSEEDAQYLVDALGTPNFEMAAQAVYEWNEGILNYIRQAVPDLGPAIDKILSESEYYVPLARAFDDVDAEMVARINRAGGGNPLKRMKGSGRRIKDIFPQMVSNAESMINMAHKRKIIDTIVALADVEGVGHLIEEVPVSQVPHSQEIARIKKQLESSGADLTGANLDEIVTFFTPSMFPKGKDPIVPVMRGGKMRWFQVDPDLYATLQGVDLYQLPKVLDLVLAAPTRAFRLGTTGLRPSFSLITNPTRDLQTFIAQTRSHANPARIAAEYVAAVGEALNPARVIGKKTKYLDAFYRLGVNLSQPLGQDTAITRRTAKGLFKGRTHRIVTSPIESLRDLFSATEAAPRLAEIRLLADEVGWDGNGQMTFDQAVQMGLGAKQVTVDFTAAGKAGKVVNQMVPFFNASIQGTRSFARAFKERPMRTTITGLIAFTIPTLLLWWKHKDEEWYEEMTDREKYMYWHIPVDDQILSIPRAFEWGNLFAVAPEAIFDSWYRKDPAGVKAAVGHIFETSTPEVMPHTLQIAKEQWQNRVDFFNRPIVPRAEQDLPPGEQRGPYTSKIAEKLGRQFPDAVSPRRVDHLIRGLGSAVASDVIEYGEYVAGVERPEREKEPSDIPVVGKLFRRGGKIGTTSKSIEKFYEEYSRTQQKQNSKDNPETRVERSYRLKVEDAAKEIKKLREKKAGANTSDENKRIHERMIQTARKALDAKPAPR